MVLAVTLAVTAAVVVPVVMVVASEVVAVTGSVVVRVVVAMAMALWLGLRLINDKKAGQKRLHDDQKECFVEGYDYDYRYDSFSLPGAVFKSQFVLYLVLSLYRVRSLILVATCPCFTPGGGGAEGLLVTWVNFLAFVPLGFQNACPIIVYSVAIL